MIKQGTAAAAMCLAATTVAAAAPGDASSRVLKPFVGCRAITGSEARVACYDKVVTALEAAVAARDVRIVDRQEIGQVKRSLFGFALPKIALLDGRDRNGEPDEPEFTEINSTIASARRAENERVELRLADEDAVWRSTERMPFMPRNGAKIRIRKGVLGNYFLTIAGERTVRGMRVR